MTTRENDIAEETPASEELTMQELLGDVPEEVRPGLELNARILNKVPEGVLVDIGLKMEGLIPKVEFPFFDQKLPFAIGETVPVVVKKRGGPDEWTQVSWRAVRERAAWEQLTNAFTNGTPVEGIIEKKVKGGYVVDLGVQAFLPGSQLDIRPVHQPDQWISKKIQVLITDLKRGDDNVIVSRKKILEIERTKQRDATLQELTVGQSRQGVITNITNFGAFVDIGGVEALVHVSDITWERIAHPKERLKVGQTVTVQILKIELEQNRISAGLKQLQVNPWDAVPTRFPNGTLVTGVVLSVTTFGAFVEIAPGIEGLIHQTEMSWKNRMPNPATILKKGQSITVRVLSYDAAQKKLGLSLKRAEANPWDEIKKKYRPGSKWKLPVSHLTNFGAFVKLPEGFDGLVHLSDFSWTEKIAQPSDRVSKGQEIDVVALSVNPEGEKIAFSIKHTQPDPFTVLKVGKSVDGKVTRSEEMGIEVLLTNGLKAWVSRRECQKGRDEKEILPAVGTDISAKVIQVLPKERKIELSIRQYERDEERKAVARYTKNQERLTLGDILISSDEDDSSTES